MEIVSLFAGKVVHSITGLDGPQGVVYVPAHDRIVVANSGDGKVRVYDGTSFDLVKILDFARTPTTSATIHSLRKSMWGMAKMKPEPSE